MSLPEAWPSIPLPERLRNRVVEDRVQLGCQHARAVVQVSVDDTVLRAFHAGDLLATVPRTTTTPVRGRKSGEWTNRRSS